MRIDLTSPPVKGLLIALCLGFFLVAWPIAFGALFGAVPGVKRTDDDTAGYSTIFGMVIIGFFMGTQGALMINEQTLWLRSKWTRTAFLILSGLFAALITREISTGGASDQQGPAYYALLYFFLVQSPPLLWFLYNLHGGAWSQALARRRNRVR